MYRLLIYDEDIFNLLKSGKSSHLFTFDFVTTPSELINRIYDEFQYDLLIINHNIIEPSYLEMFSDVKTKIIVSYEKYSVQGLVHAVKIGAVDVLEKPVDLVFLKQIVFKHLSEQHKDTIILSNGYSFLRAKCLIVSDQQQYVISNKERLLLEVLSKNINKITSYEEIEAYVWQGDFMSSDSLRTLIKNIRKKLPEDSIRTVKGFGYMLEVKEAAAV
jgi:DNA-binding response OmpR family regulator